MSSLSEIGFLQQWLSFVHPGFGSEFSTKVFAGVGDPMDFEEEDCQFPRTAKLRLKGPGVPARRNITAKSCAIGSAVAGNCQSKCATYYILSAVE
jgi:hypothetical protein